MIRPTHRTVYEAMAMAGEFDEDEADDDEEPKTLH